MQTAITAERYRRQISPLSALRTYPYPKDSASHPRKLRPLWPERPGYLGTSETAVARARVLRDPATVCIVRPPFFQGCERGIFGRRRPGPELRAI